jgi:hypothetical protein
MSDWECSPKQMLRVQPLPHEYWINADTYKARNKGPRLFLSYCKHGFTFRCPHRDSTTSRQHRFMNTQMLVNVHSTANDKVLFTAANPQS